MKRHSRLTQSKWKTHIEAWQETGGSQADYCRQHGLSDKVFSLWKRRFQKESSENTASLPTSTQAQTSTEFIPLQVLPTTREKDILLLRLPNGIELRLTSSTFNQLDVKQVRSLCQIR